MKKEASRAQLLCASGNINGCAVQKSARAFTSFAWAAELGYVAQTKDISL